MKHLTFIATLFLTSLSFGQKNNGEIVIFSSLSEPVHVILNGVLQNYQPESNLRIQGLENNWYNCRVEGPDNLFVIEKNIIVKQDTLITYRIVEKKGSYKLRYFSETPLTTSQNDQNQTVIHYHVTEAKPETVTETTTITTTTVTEASQPELTEGENVNINVNMNASSSGTEINTSSNVNDGQSTNESVEMSISVSETGMSTNININDQGNTENFSSDVNVNSSSNTTTTYSETTTITTSSSFSGSSTQTEIVEEEIASESMNTSNSAAAGSCLIDNDECVSIKNAIEAESFADDKMRVASQVAKNKCLTVDQVKKIAVLFDFSEDRLAFTKKAYHSCINKDDYYQVMSVFDFSSDKEELEKYINQQ